MHRPSPSKKRDSPNLDQREQHDQDTKSSNKETGAGSTQDSNKQANHFASVAATGTGESRICLGVVPVRVQGTGSTREVQTYALLDNGSEVILSHERLAKKLNLDGDKLKFMLIGVNGSTEVESQLVKYCCELWTVLLLLNYLK